MNNFNQEIHYRLLKILGSDNHNLTQREMAVQMGISLGKLNYCLAELVKKGFVKMNRFKDAENKLRYLYILTPRGIEEKAAITLRFLKRKMEEYEQIKQEIMRLSREISDRKDLNGFYRDLSKEIEEDNPVPLSITASVD
jgi:EPS-associated MarR family transcriptional regulator